LCFAQSLELYLAVNFAPYFAPLDPPEVP
jgi:hypothetical protein